MAHFAQIENDIVIQVIVAEQDFIDNHTTGTWVQTSYNTNGNVHSQGKTPLRKNYAGIGDTYDAIRDAFIAPQPYPSWVLDEDTCRYEAPVAYPTLPEGSTERWQWDEDTLQWIRVDED